jgi:hypothetical protein
MSKSRLAAIAGVAAATAAFAPQIAAGADTGNGARTGASAAGERVLLLYNCERGRFKPRRVIITCADENFRVRGITWSSWTTTAARGRGTALVNDCKPNCASGTFKSYPVRLRAFRPRETGGCVPNSLFTRLGWRFPKGKPAGFDREGTARLVCPASGP